MILFPALPIGEYKTKDNTRTVIRENEQGKEAKANTDIVTEVWAQQKRSKVILKSSTVSLI